MPVIIDTASAISATSTQESTSEDSYFITGAAPPPKLSNKRRNFQHEEGQEDAGLEPLIDTTKALPLRSKRTERRRKKTEHKARVAASRGGPLEWLPYEILLAILTVLPPSALLALQCVSRSLRDIVQAEARVLATRIIAMRYPSLAKCFRLPVLVDDLDPSYAPLIRRVAAQGRGGHYRHGAFRLLPAPDPSALCPCLTCCLRWNCLCVAVDFAHWQPQLDAGEPIPVAKRGRPEPWDAQLKARQAAALARATREPLHYARLLELHLASTTRAIRRHAANKADRRQHFRVTEADVRAGTDAFLDREGPPTIDFPVHREPFYMLEAYMPNRSWIREQQQWVYLTAETHDKDLQHLRNRIAALALTDPELMK